MIKFTHISGNDRETVEFTLDDSATWVQVLDTCHRFIKAIGYFPPGTLPGYDAVIGHDDDVVHTKGEWQDVRCEMEAMQDKIDHLEDAAYRARVSELDLLVEQCIGPNASHAISITDLEPLEIAND